MNGHAQRGLVLLAHGSRDPQWRRPVEAVQARLAELAPGLAVRCAYLELCEPSLAAAIEMLQADGVAQVSIVPVFLGVGRHVRDDLPRRVQALAAAHPGLALQLAPPVGEHPQLVAVLAEIALAAIS